MLRLLKVVVLQLEGDEDDEVFEGIVRDLEKRERMNAALAVVEN